MSIRFITTLLAFLFTTNAMANPMALARLERDAERSFIIETKNCLETSDRDLQTCLLSAQVGFLEKMVAHQAEKEALAARDQQDPNNHEEVAKDVVRQTTSYVRGIRQLYAGTSQYGTNDITPAIVNGGVAASEDYNGSGLRTYGNKPVRVVANKEEFHILFSQISQETCTMVMSELQDMDGVKAAFMTIEHFEQARIQEPVNSTLTPDICQRPVGTLVIAAR